MADVIAAALAVPIGWELTFLMDHGPVWFLTVHALGLLGLWCGAGVVVHAWERRRSAAATERLMYDPEPPARMPVAPDAQRRAVRPADIHDTARDDQQEGARP